MIWQILCACVWLWLNYGFTYHFIHQRFSSSPKSTFPFFRRHWWNIIHFRCKYISPYRLGLYISRGLVFCVCEILTTIAQRFLMFAIAFRKTSNDRFVTLGSQQWKQYLRHAWQQRDVMVGRKRHIEALVTMVSYCFSKTIRT